MDMKKINWNTETEPSNGYYLVEVQMCDVPDETKLFIDEYKNGYWGYGQFVNKWAEIEGWISAEIKPPMNWGVLVYIPEEDSHITSGMWDVSKKWVLLDEYRVPESEVTHWTILPDAPESDGKKTYSHRIGAR